MPEITDNFIRIPNPDHEGGACSEIRTISINASRGISALYCVTHKSVKTYLFNRDQGWTMETAQAWVKDHSKEITMDKLFTKAILEEIDGKRIAVASDEIEDREGEILSMDGWRLDNFKRNPVLLWAHNPSELPIGQAKNIRTEIVNGVKKLVFEPFFHDITEKAKAIKQMFEEGILKTFSVGFLPIEQDGNKFVNQELLEISAVPVPANPRAMMLAMSKGMDEKMVKDILGIKEEKTQHTIDDVIDSMDKTHIKLDEIKQMIDKSMPTGKTPTGEGRSNTPDKGENVARRRALQAIHKIAESLIIEEKNHEKD